MSNLDRKEDIHPSDDAPDKKLIIPNLREEFNAVFKDLDLAETYLRPILPESARIVPSSGNSRVLKISLENSCDEDLIYIFRKLWFLSPKLGGLHQFSSVQMASHFQEEENYCFPPDPVSIASLVQEYVSMLPQNSVLNLSTADIDLNNELLYSPFPTAIVRIKDFVLLNANTLYASSNQKDLGEILGRSVDSHFTPEIIEKYLADLSRSGSLSEYPVKAYLHAKKEHGGQVYEVRDEYDFITNNKRINYADADCYVFDFTGQQLIRSGEVPRI